MGIDFKVINHELVVKKDIPEISKTWKEKIKKAINEKLSRDPDFFGKPLRRSLKGYRKLRVGNYRVIFRIENKSVKIFAVKHRSLVYKKFKTHI